MKQVWKRMMALLCAVACCLGGVVLPIGAAETAEAVKWMIHDGGANGTTVTRTAGTHVEWSKRGAGVKLPEEFPLEKLGIYIRITLDAAAAEVMNKGGSIELAQEICDKSEISCNTTVIHWKEGLNEVIVPIGKVGGYNDGGQARFDMYQTINWFRFYTTPGSANLTQSSRFTIWEVSIIDSTMIGMEFGNDDVYLQLEQPLSETPATIEASVKPSRVSSEWKLGLPGAARYDATVMAPTSGTVTAEEEAAYGISAGTPWIGATVHKGGFYGTKDQKIGPVTIPEQYALQDLALSFWLYTSEGRESLPLCFYIELTSSGKCDVQELEWDTAMGEFSDLKAGWNHIVLPFASARKNGTIDLSNINFLRVWGSQNTEQVADREIDIRMSEMQVTLYTPDTDAEKTQSSFELVDGLPSWRVLDFTKSPNNWDGGVISVGNVWKNDGTDAAQPKDGTVYMEVTPGKTLVYEEGKPAAGKEYWKSGFTAGVANGFVEPHIPSQYSFDDLKFTFWMYVPRADLVPMDLAQSPNFEFTSDGDVDGAELAKSYLLRDVGGLKDGWNYIEIPLSSLSASGGFDLHSINFFRWTYMCTDKDTTGMVDECVRYADFRITATVNKGIEEVAPEQETPAIEVDPNTVYNIFSNATDGAKDVVALYLTAQGNVAWTWGDKQYVSSMNAFTGEWIDLALVRDMSQGKFLLYADGVLVDEKSAQGTPDIELTSAHCIAADAKGEGRFSGLIGDVRVWNDVRTPEEIASNRTPKQGTDKNGFDANTQGLLGSWILIGSTDNILTKQPDVSRYANAAKPCGARADQWEDYVVPTDVIGEDYHTIVFIPDTQELVTGRFTEEWLASAQWIADNVEKENIVHVIGAGDNTWTDSIAQWDIVRQGFDLFSDKVAWSNMTGNHDYPGSCLPVNDTTYTMRDTTNYQSYFGLDYIAETKAADHFVDYFKDPYGISGTENSYYRFEVNGVQWMILQIEYHPRVHVIEWANDILKQYPDDNVILTTHGYIGNDNADYCTHWMPYTKQDAEIGGYIGELMPLPTPWPGGSEMPIWTELIYPNDNVKLLLCGHASTADGHVLTRWDQNAAGNTVPQVMINAQDVDVTYFDGEAMGMLGILRFSADGSKIEIQYYSPYHGSSYHPSNQKMRSLMLAINSPTTEPIAPDGPEVPNEPNQPDQPEQPSEPQQPTEQVPKSRLPLWIGVGAIAALAVAVVAVLALKKKE